MPEPRRRRSAASCSSVPVDAEQLGVLAADPEDDGSSPSTSTLKLWFVIPPPSGSTTGSPSGPELLGDPLQLHAAILDCAVPVRASSSTSTGRSPTTSTCQCEVFQRLFAEQGRPLRRGEYYAELAGLSDAEIVRVARQRPDPAVVDRKIARYRERASRRVDRTTTKRGVPCCSRPSTARSRSSPGPARSEIEPVLAAAAARLVSSSTVDPSAARSR